MQQRRARKPRHEGGVFNRIPKPPAAPAEFVISPPAAQGDAAGQRTPRPQNPGPHPTAPNRINPAFDEGRDGKRKRRRETDIAQIEERWVKGEARVLQQRIEAPTKMDWT